MNPLKTLFNKVFEAAPPAVVRDEVSKEEEGFDWNPEEEVVPPTVANAVSWKRTNVEEMPPLAAAASIAESNPSLPSPSFEWNQPDRVPSPDAIATPSAVVSHASGRSNQAGLQAFAPLSTPEPPPAVPPPLPRVEIWQSPTAPVVRPTAPVAPPMVTATVATASQPALPLSDFEEIYRKAGIKSPIHGYGVERVYRLLTSRRLVGLDRNVRRSALLTALDAAGVPASDVAQDAVLRRKALVAYEAEKALELQSLRSRNESRVEALQDTVETFTRQKQAQIERLAQGSTAAVRAQSDLEIRKRMEQERLYRSLSYFVEPLPPPTAFPGGSAEPLRAMREEAPATVRPPEVTETVFVTSTAEVFRHSLPFVDAPASTAAPATALVIEPPGTRQIAAVTPSKDEEAETVPVSRSGLEMALRAAAEEARSAGWGRTAIVQDSSADAVDALRKLRETQKPDQES